MLKKMMVAAALMTAVSGASAAETGAGVSAACRGEVVKLCPATGDRAARRACMIEKRGSLSDQCRGEIRAAMLARRAARGAAVQGEGQPQ